MPAWQKALHSGFFWDRGALLLLRIWSRNVQKAKGSNEHCNLLQKSNLDCNIRFPEQSVLLVADCNQLGLQEIGGDGLLLSPRGNRKAFLNLDTPSPSSNCTFAAVAADCSRGTRIRLDLGAIQGGKEHWFRGITFFRRSLPLFYEIWKIKNKIC